MKDQANKRTIPRDNFYVISSAGTIDLTRSPKDYLDLRDELQRHTNQSKDPFPINLENHVKALVKDVYENMSRNRTNDECIIHECELSNPELSIFFTFGLPPHAQSVTIKS